MNATRWETLSIFVKHLGKTGQVTVDWTEKGKLSQQQSQRKKTTQRK
jgi:hypothetical protein